MSLIFLSYFFALPALALILLQISGFSLLRLGLIQFVTIRLLVFSFIGTLPLFFGLDRRRLNSGVDDPNLVLQVMLFSGATILLFVIGAMFARNILKSPAIANSFTEFSVNKTESMFLVLLLMISISVLMLYLSQLSDVAILVALAGDAGVAEARSSMTNNFQGKYHWYNLFMIELAKIVSFSFFCAFLIIKRKLFLILFLISFLALVFSLTMSAQKGPLAWTLIGLFMVYAASRHRGRYPVRGLFIVGLTVFLATSAMYIVTGSQDDLIGAGASIVSRSFAGSIQPAYHYLQFFPKVQGFLMGGSFPNPGGFFPWGGYSITVEVMNWFDPTLADRGIVGSMPTVFWGEAYANFGYLGIVIVPFFAGFLLFFIDRYFSKIRDAPIKVGFYVWMILHYSKLAQTGFSGYLIDLNMLVLLTIFLFVILASNRMKIAIQGKSIE
jgi:oligosaccharide repeat unit polymerase